MELETELSSIRNEIQEILKQVKKLKSKSQQVRVFYKQTTEPNAEIDLFRLNQEFNIFQDRIDSIVALDSSHDISIDLVEFDNLDSLGKEVFNNKREIIKLNSKITDIKKTRAKDKEEASLKVNSLREEIDELIHILGDKYKREVIIMRVLNPSMESERESNTAEAKMDKALADKNSTFVLIVHIVFGLVLFPLFGPVAGAAAGVNFWRLIRKWNKQREENDYKKEII